MRRCRIFNKYRNLCRLHEDSFKTELGIVNLHGKKRAGFFHSSPKVFKKVHCSCCEEKRIML